MKERLGRVDASISGGSRPRQMETVDLERRNTSECRFDRAAKLTFFGAMDQRRQWARQESKEEDYELKQLRVTLVSVDLRRDFSPCATCLEAPETSTGPRYALWSRTEDISCNLISCCRCQ